MDFQIILESQPCLVARTNQDQEKIAILEKLLFRIRSVKKAKKSKYVLMNAPNDQLENIIALLPGMRSPTILPLAKEGWSSGHSVLSEDKFWEIIENLKAAGAEGILVVPIEKMIL